MAPNRRGGRRDRDRDFDMDAGAGRPNNRNPGRNPAGTANPGNNKKGKGPKNPQPSERVPRGKLVQVRVTGWTANTSGHADQGYSAIRLWLEQKMSKRQSNARQSNAINKRQVKMIRPRRAGDVLIFSVPEADVKSLLSMNNWGWQGAKLTIERIDDQGTSEQPQQLSKDSMILKEVFKNFLMRRYDGERKLLDLSAMYSDPELQRFKNEMNAAKFFAALMKVLQEFFDRTEDLYAAVHSVTLADNELENLDKVKDLSYALPRLQNLDLSNNKFERLDALDLWRRRFRDLQHLVVTGNPFLVNEPDYAQELINRYPNLRILNTLQVRTEEDVARRRTTQNLPLPIKGPLFVDQNPTVVDFVTQWFYGFDNERTVLAQLFYEPDSVFSLAINGSAPRDPAGTVTTEAQEWGVYMKYSRNLKKVHGLGARMGKSYVGTAEIAELFNDLPLTQHPNLLTEARKWMIESNPQPGVRHPDHANGVNGAKISIHGEFEEIDPRTGAKKRRSMDHQIVIGPGTRGVGTIRVLTHELTIRAYGGSQAFEPDVIGNVNAHTPPSPAAIELEPYQLAHLDQNQAVALCNQLSASTGMVMQFCKDCLDQANWQYDVALATYDSVKPSLGAEAYVNGKPLR